MSDLIAKFHRNLAIGQLWAASAARVHYEDLLNEAAKNMVEYYLALK